MMAGARIEVNESKHNPMDFALWKAANQVNHSGKAHGAMVVLAGILNVLLCL